MTDNTEYNIVEFNDISGKLKGTSSENEETLNNEFGEVNGIESLNNEPVIVESELIPNPWDDAPSGVWFYDIQYEDGRLGNMTQSAERAYKRGWDLSNNIPVDDVQVSDINHGYYPKELCPMKTEEEKQKEIAEQRFIDIQTAVQAVLDRKAKEKNYDNGFAVASYALSTNDIFRSDAAKFIAWRDAVWAKCYQILDAYKAGEIEMPSVENVIAVLPELEWDDE